MSEKPIQVWVRSLGNACRIRVDEAQKLRWLVDQLSRNPDYRALEKRDLKSARENCLIHISTNEGGSLASLETALSQIPGVQLMIEPEYR